MASILTNSSAMVALQTLNNINKNNTSSDSKRRLLSLNLHLPKRTLLSSTLPWHRPLSPHLLPLLLL